MGKTIIQPIGPLYGEAVNGTVFGQPNGSIYVPSQNTISISLVEATRYVRYNSAQGVFYICNSAGSSPFGNSDSQIKAIAESQDQQNYIAFELSDTDDFTKKASSLETAGNFNISKVPIGSTVIGDPVFTVSAGVTYYVRGVLYSNSGVPVATSDTIELTGVVL